MLEPNRIQSEVYPSAIQRLGNGSYYYNYDILEIEAEVNDMDPRTEIQYNFIQVLLQGQPDYKNCVKAIIRSFISTDEEFDLINSYNSYILNPTEDSKALSEYMEYLNKLQEIKNKVKEDFTKL